MKTIFIKTKNIEKIVKQKKIELFYIIYSLIIITL